MNIDKALAATAVILGCSKRRQMSHLKLLKLLYRAERRSWQERGCPLVGDNALAMKYGPLPEGIYKLIKGEFGDHPQWVEFLARWKAHFTKPGENSVGIAKKPPIGSLSEYEVRILKEETANAKGMSPFDVSDATHEFAEWVRNNPGTSSKPIPLRHVLEAVRPDDVDKLLEEQDYFDQVDDLLAGTGTDS